MIAGSKVVVVEDDDGMRGAIERLLGAAGFQTAVYPSAEAALAARVDSDAVCWVSDLKLPGISGLDLLAELHARGQWQPLILITAHDASGLCEEAARRGAAGYLAKPFRGTVLVDIIQATIQTPGPR